MAKLDVKALGLSVGITWAGAIVFMGLVCRFSGWGVSFVDAMGKLYLGYKPTFIGSAVGGIWGFLDMGIAGVVIAWLYNKFTK